MTIRCFRETFSDVIAECGFTEAVTPFIPAMPGLDPMGNEELRSCSRAMASSAHSAVSSKPPYRTVGVGRVASDAGVGRVASDAGVGRVASDAGVGRVASDVGIGRVASDAGVGRVASDVGRAASTMPPNGWEIANVDVGNRTPEQSNNRTILRLTPQFIGKDPAALRSCLERIKAAGYDTADLNAGCPFTMVRNKGRGSGLLKTPDVLRRMLEVGCAVMGEGRFSLKARLGVDRNDELLGLMPLVNEFPLRFLTVHARNARQMYAGRCDVEMLRAIERVAKVPVVENGDIPFPPRLAAQTEVNKLSTLEEATGDIAARRGGNDNARTMIGRGFIRYLGTREDAGDLLRRYIESSRRELCGDRPVLGRMKELVSYWKDLPNWRRKWNVVKICRSVDELRSAI